MYVKKSGLVLWQINHYRLFNTEFILCIETVLFQTTQFSKSTQFKYQTTSISNYSV